ncbi:MAG: TIGR02679 family protein [Clostridia bacterium]|nr:TIGR02679 family protein [Clostridia bacterium]
MGGTVLLSNLSDIEKEALSCFLKKDISKQKSITVKIDKIKKCLEQTKFCKLRLEDVVGGYFGEEVHFKVGTIESHRFEREKYFRELVDKYKNTRGGQWLKKILLNNDDAYRIIIQSYDIQRKKLYEDLDTVCRALNGLSEGGEEKVYLPDYAFFLTQNPHALDEETICGKLFLSALLNKYWNKKPVNLEKKIEIYYRAGILINDVSNYVLCSGLQAFTEERLHKGWEGFYQTGEPLLVTLSNLGHLKKMVSTLDKVFVFENSEVFAAIHARTANYEQKPKCSLVCTCGQLKITTLALLDMLVKEGTIIYYSGNFDPEGLLMADHLSTRYGKNLCLWRYTNEDYNRAISCKILSEGCLKKFNRLRNKSLRQLAEQIKKRKLIGYQELLLDQLSDDISEKLLM